MAKVIKAFIDKETNTLYRKGDDYQGDRDDLAGYVRRAAPKKAKPEKEETKEQ